VLRLQDLEIPYEAVVGGLRRRVYERLPRSLRIERPTPSSRRSFNIRLAQRMWTALTFMLPSVVHEISFGRDSEMADFSAVDAVGYSAAIPGVLQYMNRNPDDVTEAHIHALKANHELAALVDGVTANNVPARTAWQGVWSGRIGTRNAFYLAFDCFHPQWDNHHLWLWPIAQLVYMQMPGNRPYIDKLIKFKPTLSPINLLPRARQMALAFEWGYKQMDAEMPLVEAAMRPVEWRPN